MADSKKIKRKRPSIGITIDPDILKAVDILAEKEKSKRSNIINDILLKDPMVRALINEHGFFELSDDNIARMCHELWCVCDVCETAIESWDELTEDGKETVLWGVSVVRDHPDITPSELYEYWKERKKESGWSHGKTKDKNEMKHPCILKSFDELPDEERKNYELFIKIILTLI